MLFVFAAIISLVITAVLYYKRRPTQVRRRLILLFGLRFISLFILLVILLSPILYFSRERTKQPILLVMQDVSHSMETQTEGISKAKSLYEPMSLLIARYKDEGYKIAQYDFADGIEGGAENSLLGKSLQEISKKEDISQIQAILLASDGWFRDGDYSLVSRLGIPILALADTTSYVYGDLSITGLHTNRYAYRNESTILRAKVLATDYSGPAKVNLYLAQNRISSKNLNLESGVEEIAEFDYRFPQTGFFNYRVEVEPLDKEQRLGNNVYPGAIEVLSEKEHIVVFSDAPGWDNKFILDAVASNPRWQSISYQLRNGVVYRGEEQVTLPADEQPVVIVIINNGNLRLDAQSRRYIEDRLKRGAGLLYQGLPILELSEYLPLMRSNIISPYQGFVQLSDAAEMYPMLSPLKREVSKLPPLDYYYTSVAAGSELLAVMNNPQKTPGIAVRHSANSRALSFCFLNLWRWQLQSSDAAYQKMVVNILTWLSNKALGSYSAIYKNSYMQGENVVIRLRAEDEIRSHDLDKNPKISIFDADGKLLIQDFMIRSNEEYTFSTELSHAGDYRFEISEAASDKSSKGSFAISEMSVEARDFGFNLPLLGFLANQSRGKIIPINEIDKHQALAPVLKQEILRREINLYKMWYIPALFILSFCLELFFRRRWGLL